MKKKKALGKMMPFVPQLAASVEEGRTCFSFRYHPKPFYPKPGEVFSAHSERKRLDGVYRCRRRVKSSIREVRDKHWKNIGVASPEAYEELMKMILKTDTLEYDKPGYLYIFDRET